MSRLVIRHEGTVQIVFPMKTTNPNNGNIGWSKNAAYARARRNREQRDGARAMVLSARPLPDLPVVVTVTRVAPSSGLDPHDGLRAALKRVVDGIADALGLANDRDPRVTWRYDQRRGAPGKYGVEVEIAPGGAELQRLDHRDRGAVIFTRARSEKPKSNRQVRPAGDAMGRRRILPPDEAPNEGARLLRTRFLLTSRRSVARLTGLHVDALSRYARGQRTPDPDARSKMAVSLAIPPESWAVDRPSTSQPTLANRPSLAVNENHEG